MKESEWDAIVRNWELLHTGDAMHIQVFFKDRYSEFMDCPQIVDFVWSRRTLMNCCNSGTMSMEHMDDEYDQLMKDLLKLITHDNLEVMRVIEA